MTANITQLTVHAVDNEAEPEQMRQERGRRIAERERRVEARRVERSFRKAAARATDPKDQMVYRLDVKLLHPTVPLSVDADYPGWAELIAAREADNRRAKEAK